MINKKIYVGVVGLGDLEILMFLIEKKEFIVKICIGSDGFGEVWNNVLMRFFDCYLILVDIVINDFGVILGVVYLWLM